MHLLRRFAVPFVVLLFTSACGNVANPTDSGSGMDAEVGADSGPTCAAPRMTCGSRCVDTQSDHANCGACGHACEATEVCALGGCALSCPAPQTACAGQCASLDTDNANCGTCGNACAAGEVCAGGHCTFDCGTLATCGGDGGVARFCVDRMNDPNNCGACGRQCGPGNFCVGGGCRLACPSGQMACGSMCADFTSDPRNCGACGAACGDGQVCVGSICSATCATGQNNCSGFCVDVQTDPHNCGGCSHDCETGEVCNAGRCEPACPTGRTVCSGSCVDTQTDNANCGTCAHACSAGQVCSAGMCAASCVSGQTNCSGRCVTLSNDVNNCGGCGTRCTGGQICNAGSCMTVCAPPQVMCGSTCTTTAYDPLNCGACGTVCPSGQACVSGACRVLAMVDGGCAPPSVTCGPVCTDIRSDNAHCGSCTVACTPDRTCASGMCLPPCTAGQARCGTTCTNVQFDRNNCGTCGNVCGPSLSCSGGACVTDPTFRVTSMTTSGCMLSGNEETTAGDDCGGLGVGLTQVFYTGDSTTVRIPASDLSSITTVTAPSPPGRFISLVSDLRSGDVYTLLDAAGTSQPTSSFSGTPFTVRSLGLLDQNTGALTTTRVALSMPLSFGSDSVGVYSGFGRVIFYTNSGDSTNGWYNVDLPSGLVRAISTGATAVAPPDPSNCETFAHWGTAEYYAGDYHVLYAQSFSATPGIARFTPSTGMLDPTLVADFGGSGGDICMAIFSPARNRWYFHFEGTPGFVSPPGGIFGEFVGYCPGTFDSP